MKLRCLLPVLLSSALIGADRPQAGGERFKRDDPIAVDHDRFAGPKPSPARVSDYYDFVENTFLHPGDPTRRRAANVNTVGEVPDSSWYTNRVSRGRLSIEELTRGPDRGTGPASGPWTVVRGKSQGVTPGFVIRDARGDEYFLKFDPPSNPEMATSAEIISTKFFHALGYNVPENYLVTVRPEDLAIDPAATVSDAFGKKQPLRRNYLEALLARVAHAADGSIRATASKRLPGESLGPFKFYGTRWDDPNDVFPHEHRRELRGYRVFCAWLNHDDSRSINTLDLFVREGEQGYVKHFLIDFGATLGSASVFAQPRRRGNEYAWEPGPTMASIASMGLWLRPWAAVPYPDFPSVGRFEAEFFRPERWKPEYPNRAFSNLDVEDAFWAARQVVRFSDADIRAIVKTGRLSDPAAEDYLVRCLITRRDKIADYWLRQVSSLDDFRVEGESLAFTDLLARGDEQSYSVKFARFDNGTAASTPLSEAAAQDGCVLLPQALVAAPEGSYFSATFQAGARAATVYIKRSGGGLRIVGIERN
jgi:hypothetical protein